MKILVIDDNEGITRMLSKYLELNNHQCTVSNKGQNGLALILAQKFDVVLLDLAIPEFDGFDIIDALVKKGKIGEQKIILFTASNVPKDIEKLLDLGVHSYITKPISMELLQRTISS